MSQVGVVSQPENRYRKEWGHVFKWNYETQEWETTTGRQVFIKVPNAEEEDKDKIWLIRVPGTKINMPFIGEDAEQRAFCVAEGYSRQKD